MFINLYYKVGIALIEIKNYKFINTENVDWNAEATYEHRERCVALKLFQDSKAICSTHSVGLDTKQISKI